MCTLYKILDDQTCRINEQKELTNEDKFQISKCIFNNKNMEEDILLSYMTYITEPDLFITKYFTEPNRNYILK